MPVTSSILLCGRRAPFFWKRHVNINYSSARKGILTLAVMNTGEIVVIIFTSYIVTLNYSQRFAGDM
jgi:hypothetical protein